MQSTANTILIRVRYAECDAMGVAHHSVYPIWFEMGRTELLRETGLTYRELEAVGIFLAVVKLNIAYKRPAHYDDELALETTLATLGHVKIEHEYRLFRDSTKHELLAMGASTLACLDRNGTPQPLPELLTKAASR